MIYNCKACLNKPGLWRYGWHGSTNIGLQILDRGRGGNITPDITLKYMSVQISCSKLSLF